MGDKFECQFCRKKFFKFDGFNKFVNIKDWSESKNANGVYAAMMKNKYGYPDNSYLNHLNINHSTKQVFCPCSKCEECGVFFKYHRAYQRHMKKYHASNDEVQDKTKKQVLRDLLEVLMKNAIDDGYDLDDMSIELKLEE